ncbi:class I SAM-dependent methyltransferase [Desulforamulus aeronauticus]|uniref:Putative SAM-dependent methyltransferase n=1 Tax=Desulforamulus aeronauticus DSM 10349 TaxID=1121421 RepID=A0A1M6UPV6_9FIRM|nr:class I SAM-dependent methyltransferase [Desulforamulus aeronauticus]SHK71189.1 Putative SAM-dependent methyltransferase [Desulforamulus aeronauticus DSM 10349]
MKDSLVITTGIRSGQQLAAEAVALSQELQVPYLPRDKQSLQAIREQSGANIILMVRKERLSLVVDGKELFFHPGLAKLRIKEIQAGKTDQMIRAMDLKEGDTLLDCTLGLASDALVASYVAGARGRVVGLEDSRPVAEIVSRGLQSYRGEKPAMLEAMRRIQVYHDHHVHYLKQLPDNSFDVVYFDPMFREPQEKSSSLSPLRPLANHHPLSPEAVRESIRVARKRVVMKERSQSQEFFRLGFHTLQGGRYSPVAYGIIRKGGVEQ